MSHVSKFKSALPGIYLAALLWITILSRIGTGPVARPVYPPFWSFAEIAAGNRRVILWTAENILLFVPFGFLSRRFWGWSRKKTILFGFLCTLLIECAQLISGLGSFEVDDLFTNTLGTVFGSLIPASKQKPARKWYYLSLAAFAMTLCAPPLLSQIQYRYMERLAANGDRADGTKNLLILNGQPGFVGNSDFFVSYLRDGNISISGSSNIRAWKRIGDITLEPGSYSFSGLSGTEEKTVAIVLEYFDPETKKSIKLTKDVGPVDESDFVISDEKNIKAYVSIYPNAEGYFTAFPVIYREE